jgi:exopolyphosphatase/guanosine-5'-triphosphate,3'-diphosphate pyrophosphatase
VDVSGSGRVGAIDCGTNSIRLLIAEPSNGRLRDVHREMRIVRLGQGIDATGRFAPEALNRTRAALVDYAGLLARHGVERIRMVATSATRDAANREVFFAMTADVLGGAQPGAIAEVITGAQEAELSFRGAVAEMNSTGAPFVVVDLGGGSTEVVLGDDGAGEVRASFSADIGCVRLTERCLHSDPPTLAEVAHAREVVRERLGEALNVVPVERAGTWVGVAGTMTTLSALAQGLTVYDAAAIHLSRVPVDELLTTCRQLIGMTRAQRAALGPMHEGRADVIGGGAIVVEELARELTDRAGIGELVVSEHDILDGIALSITGERTVSARANDSSAQ